MCGIVGGVSEILNNEKLQDQLVACLSHRGPDDRGVFFDKNSSVFLGQTRLSIIDLSPLGHQPMQYISPLTGKEYWITFNGEIYNYKEIKKELLSKKYIFKSDSDTEVILAAFDAWGIKCVEKFIGMFAFALWSSSEEKLWLCRDRFGVKPLYYFSIPGHFIFASEMKVFKSYPVFKSIINLQALSSYFQLGYITGDITIFDDVHKVHPGSYLTVSADGSVEKHIYWSPIQYCNEEKITGSELELGDLLRNSLKKSFEYRLIADVDVGIFLSGGTDSSLVTALLSSSNNRKLKTFTLGFEEVEYDEAPTAKRIAKILGTDHYEHYISAKQVQDLLPEYGKIFDEPFGDASGFVTYILSKFAREQVKVALTGDGGDELFGGYSKYSALLALHKFGVSKRLLLQKALQLFGPRNAAVIYNSLAAAGLLPAQTNVREKIYKLTLSLQATTLREQFILAGSYWDYQDTKNLLSGADTGNLLRNFTEKKLDDRLEMQIWDIENYLPNDILVKSDRTSMRVGLEGREPYLDHELWRLVNRLPNEFKYKNFGNKQILKNVLADYLPADILNRPKTGFHPPIHEWLRGPWKKYLQEYLRTEKIKKEGVLNPQFVDRILCDFNQGKYTNPGSLWLLLAFELWYEEWFGS